MRPAAARLALLGLLLAAVPAAQGAENARDAYRALGIKEKQVITGTVLTGNLFEAPDRQVVAMVTYFTGQRGKGDAVNVRLGVFTRAGDALQTVYSRDFGQERGGFVARGEVELLDLDRDGHHEIVLSYDNVADPVVHERLGEVIYLADEGFRVGWSGRMEYDATRSARDVPAERRDRFSREIDLAETMRARGVTLFVNKTVYAVAGERLPEPRVLRETFALKPSDDRW